VADVPLEALQLRRQRREERRQRQREQNVHRAAKMHAARLAYEGSDAASEAAPAPAGVHIGCSGWFYWHWRDDFYPPGTPSSRWFDFYASRFRTVELNAPFYSWPTVATVQTWLRQAGRRRFVYTVKVSELITHVKRFAGCKTLVRDFGLIADLLGRRMGCFLFQLPPSVHYSAAMLKRIVGTLDPRRRNVVEFRHRSWWREDVYRAFADHNITFCSTSGPRLPDELVKTTDEAYIRFHGLKQWYRHNYSREELAVWASRIRSANATRTWAYFNNDRNCYAIRNARMLQRLLKASAPPRVVSP
jgi:uncharacterized protein YecE (DUF72 family)